jgi:protein-tyrosine phosphatase
MPWELGDGVVELPDGVRLRGRGLHRSEPTGSNPEWVLYLLAREPIEHRWPYRWVRWPDFRLPANPEDARSALECAYVRAARGSRVEVACRGGVGRTGTALACIAQFGGVEAGDAIAWVRRCYHPRAVETPWQRRYVRRFMAPDQASRPA